MLPAHLQIVRERSNIHFPDQVLVYGVPGPDRKQAAEHKAARRGTSAADTARRRALNASHLAATFTGLPLYEPPPCSPTGGARRLAAFQQVNKTHQPRRSSAGVERVAELHRLAIDADNRVRDSLPLHAPPRQ